jgi:hypothetical protein
VLRIGAARAATTSCAAAKAAEGATGMKMGIFDGIQAKDIDGKMVDLGKTYGKVADTPSKPLLLVVLLLLPLLPSSLLSLPLYSMQHVQERFLREWLILVSLAVSRSHGG